MPRSRLLQPIEWNRKRSPRNIRIGRRCLSEWSDREGRKQEGVATLRSPKQGNYHGRLSEKPAIEVIPGGDAASRSAPSPHLF